MCDCNSSFGSRFGAAVGGQVHNKVAKQAKRLRNWAGLGDYSVNYNSLINGDSGADLQVSDTGRGLRIKFKEYLGEIQTGNVVGEFNIQQFVINPGNVRTFPWLCAIANQFDQYKPHGCLFEYVSTVGDYTTNGAIGSVIMMTDYDITDAAPTNKRYMLNTAYSQEAKMSENAVHGIECDPSELQRNVFYTRQLGVVPANGVRDFDVGNFYIATQGGTLPVQTLVGSLYVHYDVELLKEQPYGGLNQLGMLYAMYGVSYGVGAPLTTAWPTMPLVIGKDMGLSLTPIVGQLAAVTFPSWFAGCVVRLDFFRSSSALQASTASSDYVFGVTEGSVINTPAAIFGNNAEWFPSWTNSTENSFFTGQTQFVRFNSNLTSAPQVYWSAGSWPDVLATGTPRVALAVTVYPSNFYN